MKNKSEEKLGWVQIFVANFEWNKKPETVFPKLQKKQNISENLPKLRHPNHIFEPDTFRF